MSKEKTKLELTKAFPNYYSARAAPTLVTFGPLPYLTIGGQGEPEGVAHTAALSELYGAAYRIKGLCKGAGNDFTVPKLEGLWWVSEEEILPPLSVPRDRWHWRLLLRLPDFVTEEHVQMATSACAERSEQDQQVRFETLDEGTCVQILHLGPYSTEPETLKTLDAFIECEGLQRNGLHHEIYLSDPRRSAPDQLRTILRQPVR